MINTVNERVIEIPWALMQLPQHGLILDVGSCDAAYLDVITQPFRGLHCLDPRGCSDHIPATASFFQQSLIGCTLKRHAYHAVLLLSTIEHIGLPCYGQEPFENGDILSISEAWSLLKPTGRLVVTVPAGLGKVTSWYRQYSPAMLHRLFQGWQYTITYWGYDDANYYHQIEEDQVEGYDYRDHPFIGAGAGAMAGIVAYPTF